MMAISTNVANTGANDTPVMSDKIFDQRNSLDVTSLEDQQDSGSLMSHSYHIYSKLVTEKLRAVVESNNCAPFGTMLAKIMKPGYDDYGNKKPLDHIKLTCIVRIFGRELGQIDQQLFTPIILQILEFQKWSRLSPALTNAYLQFFSVLVSVSPKWWVEVANKVIKEFSSGLSVDYTPHHLAIKQIMSNVPISSTAFSALFSEHFPHKSSSSNEIQSYVQQLLTVSSYAPDQASAIWRLVIGRLIELDVECHGDEDDGDIDSTDDSDSDIDSESDVGSDFDSDSDASSTDLSDDDVDSETESIDTLNTQDDGLPPSKRMRIESMNEGDEATAVELNMAELQEPMRKKVDDVMTLILKYLSKEFTHKRILSGEVTPLFNIMLQTFKEIVLPTSRPKSVQFLWFYLVHGHPDLIASFVSVLLETSMSRDYSVDQRCRALQYVASFVARAKGLSREQIVFVVSFLAAWIRRYVREREVEVESASSMAKFKVFYSAVQALFYIFVFKHSMLRTDAATKGAQAGTVLSSQQQVWEADLDKLFPEVINTKFNPLQYCQPDVVAMFARIAQNEEVASCYSIIERNRWGKFRAAPNDKRTRTGASYGLFDNNRDSKLYDSFFPFQPLKLEQAKLFINDIYEKWSEQDSSSESESDYEM